MAEQLPKWDAVGVEPPTVLKTDGWQPGVKPAAQHMNWIFNRIYKCLEEIQLNGGTDEIQQELAALQELVAAHQSENVKHITAEERLLWNGKETPDGARKKIEQTSFSTIKSNKDAEGIYTIVEQRRKTDGTLAVKAVLSGGTSPHYTTRTLTYYALDGTTVEKTETFSISYDTDGDFVSEV